LIHKDDREFWNTHSPSRFLYHLSTLAVLLELEGRNYEGLENNNNERFFELISKIREACQQSQQKNNPLPLVQLSVELVLDCGIGGIYQGESQQTIHDMLKCAVDDRTYSDSLSGENEGVGWVGVASVVVTTTSVYYDIFVPTYNNYLSNGIINHNSGKSIGVGDIMALKMRSEGADIYCLREYQDSISDSVHRVLAGSIKDRCCFEGFTINENRITDNITGAITSYKGAARNPDSIQSAQNYKYSWFEEGHRASQASLDKLLPTILRNPGAQCWFTANPQSSADPFSQRFIMPYKNELDANGYYEDDLHVIVVLNWQDNPWWNDEQERLRSWDFEHLSRAKYDWVWQGAFNDEVDNSIIKAEFFDAAIDAHKMERLKTAFKPHGARVAAHDPSDTGSDSKGYALRHGSIIKRVLEKHTGEIDEGCDWAISNAIKDKADIFIWDSDGMGAGLKRQIATGFKGIRTKTHAFRGSLSGIGQDNADKIYMPVDNDNRESKTYAETFKNNRAQYYLEMARRFFNTYRCVVRNDYVDPEEMISIDSDGVENMAALRSEMCRIPEKTNPSSGLRQLMTKDQMKKLGIKSPNMSDSIMMSFANPPDKKKWGKLKYDEVSIV